MRAVGEVEFARTGAVSRESREDARRVKLRRVRWADRCWLRTVRKQGTLHPSGIRSRVGADIQQRSTPALIKTWRRQGRLENDGDGRKGRGGRLRRPETPTHGR